MKITFTTGVKLGEFDKAALKKKFIDLIACGELRPQNSDDYYLPYGEPEQVYVLAPYITTDGENKGYILLTEEEWNG